MRANIDADNDFTFKVKDGPQIILYPHRIDGLFIECG